MIVLRQKSFFSFFGFGNLAKAGKLTNLAENSAKHLKDATNALETATKSGADAATLAKHQQEIAKSTQYLNKYNSAASWEKAKGYTKLGVTGLGAVGLTGAAVSGATMNNALSGDMGRDGY